jgi:hypothetical protein
MIIYLFFLHFLGDFVFQTRKIAENKGCNICYLILHCLFYWATFTLGTMFVLYDKILVLTLTHFIIDFVSSRITKYLWSNNKIHGFWIAVGFDQFLHMTTILLLFSF